MTDKLTDILAALVQQNASNRLPSFQQVKGLSDSILSGVPVVNPYDSGANGNAHDARGPSFVNRILDILSRPEYAVLSGIQGAVDRGNPTGDKNKPSALINSLEQAATPSAFKDFWAGLSGKNKMTGRDILEQNNIGENWPGIAKAATAFGIDVVADPLTWIDGVGVPGKIADALKIGKGAERSTEALADLEKGTGKSAQGIADQIAANAGNQAKKYDIEVPKAGEPAPLPGSPPRLFQAGPGPVGLAEQAERDALKASPIEESIFKDPHEPIEGPYNPFESTENASKTPITGISNLTDAEIANLSKADVDNLFTNGAMKDRSALHKKLRPYYDNLNSGTGKKLTEQLALPSAEKKLPAVIDQIKELHKQMEGVKSPIVKNILKNQVEKLSAGVKPADLLDATKAAPPAFPALTIAPRWIDAAKQAAEAFLKNNRLKDINHVGQSNLYNRVLNAASKVRKDRRAFTVFQMLRVAEEHVLGAGRHLTDAEGISARLSDVANMGGGPKALNAEMVDDFRKAKPSQWLENIKAVTTPGVVSDILDPVMQTAKDMAPTVDALPPSQTVRVGSQLSKELAKIAYHAGASKVEAKTAKAFIDDLFNPARDKLYTTIHQQARELVRQTSTGVVNPRVLSHVSNEVYKSLGANPKVLGKALEQSKVVEGIMTKFATWWGAKDLRPFARQYIDTARNVAAAFSETMRPLVTSTTASQRKIAWSIAQGKAVAGSVQEQALADEFSKMAERLMGTHGITNNAEAVVMRSGTVMDELNKSLPKEMQFIASRGTDDLGRAYDYSKGNWMDSWKEWKSNEPAETLYQLTRNLQMVTRKNAMWDDAAARWGLPVKGAEYQHEATNIARLKGTHFPQQIATQLNNLQAQLERDVFKTPHKAIALFDKVQRMWKTGVTIYSPSHHVRNLNGDVYLATLDGVTTPKPYLIATKVLHAFPTRYKDLEDVYKIMDPDLKEAALRSRPGNVVLTTKHGDKVTAEQLYQAAETQGLFSRAVNLEELSGDGNALGTFGSKFQPFNGKVYDAASRVSELREHWVRLAHFTDVLTKSNQPLKVAIEQAGRRVKKFHPDGMDLTGFEQNVLRRVIPFYSWLRKATPLVIEGALMHPAITLAFPKAMADMQLATGIESQGPGNPFPVDQMFPEWLKDKGIGPVVGPDSWLGRQDTWRGHAPGDTIINPSTAFLDQLQQIGNPGQTIESGLTPALRIPMELLTGNSSLGIPLSNSQGGTPGYLAQQIPAVGIAARLSGATRDHEPFNPEQLINYLTGAGVTGTGPYQGQGQTEIRQALQNLANKNRGDYK